MNADPSVEAAIQLSQIPATYRATLLVLASFSPKRDGIGIWPSLPKVANRLGRKRSMVQKHVTWLLAHGLLILETDRLGGWNTGGNGEQRRPGGRSARYRIDPAAVSSWTPSTTVLGVPAEKGGGPLVPRYQDPWYHGTRGPLVPGYYQDPRSEILDEKCDQPSSAAEPAADSRGSLEAAAPPIGQAEEARSGGLTVELLIQFGRRQMRLDNELPNPPDTIELSRRLEEYAGAIGIDVDPRRLAAVTDRVWSEAEAETPIAPIAPIAAGRRSPNDPYHRLARFASELLAGQVDGQAPPESESDLRAAVSLECHRIGIPETAGAAARADSSNYIARRVASSEWEKRRRGFSAGV